MASSPPLRERPDRPPRFDVVLVEDHPDTREMMEEALEVSGLTVRSFATARDALLAIRARLPDVLLTDLNVGSTSGFDLARALRDDPATASLTIVALSGSATPEDADPRLFDTFMTKPADPLRVAEEVRRLASRRGVRAKRR
jgi:CheY-like chemotaxis protein